jgi:hypothetical protein
VQGKFLKAKCPKKYQMKQFRRGGLKEIKRYLGDRQTGNSPLTKRFVACGLFPYKAVLD